MQFSKSREFFEGSNLSYYKFRYTGTISPEETADLHTMCVVFTLCLKGIRCENMFVRIFLSKNETYFTLPLYLPLLEIFPSKRGDLDVS